MSERFNPLLSEVWKELEQEDKCAVVASYGQAGSKGSVWILDRAVHNYFSYRNGYVKRYLVAPNEERQQGYDSLDEALKEFKKRTNL